LMAVFIGGFLLIMAGTLCALLVKEDKI